jgi:hypothetical protein
MCARERVDISLLYRDHLRIDPSAGKCNTFTLGFTVSVIVRHDHTYSGSSTCEYAIDRGKGTLAPEVSELPYAEAKSLNAG